jgi:hypothetical protein
VQIQTILFRDPCNQTLSFDILDGVSLFEVEKVRNVAVLVL